MQFLTNSNTKDKLAELQALIDSGTLSVHGQAAAEADLQTLASGYRGESEVAFVVNELYGSSKNWAVIRDLRLPVDDTFVQMDHLLINRFLEITVIESKNFEGQYVVDESGRWSVETPARKLGIPSPIHQLRRQIELLERFFKTKSSVQLPTRALKTIFPKYKGVAVLSNKVVLTVAKDATFQFPLLKVDELRGHLVDASTEVADALTLLRVVGEDTLANFASQLASCHVPLESTQALAAYEREPIVVTTQGSEQPLGADKLVTPASPGSKLVCATCQNRVPYVVAQFCWRQKHRFKGEVFCREHQ